MKIALFGLTGVGNSVLSALVSAGFAPAQIVTREEAKEYPYYPTPHLSELAEELSIPYSISDEYHKRTEHCDVLVIATFHRILARSFLESFRFKFNIHPSLLPLYRGPNPFYWVLRNQEKQTGISIHELGEEIDQGPIFWQQTITIDKNETQGSLRLRLSNLAGQGIIDVLNQVADDRLENKLKFKVTSTYFPKPTKTDFTIDFSRDAASVASAIRAIIPYPGFLIDGRIITNVRSHSSPMESVKPGTVVKKDPNFYLVATGTNLIMLTFDR